jgi:hypothetical protein
MPAAARALPRFPQPDLHDLLASPFHESLAAMLAAEIKTFAFTLGVDRRSFVDRHATNRIDRHEWDSAKGAKEQSDKRTNRSTNERAKEKRQTAKDRLARSLDLFGPLAELIQCSLAVDLSPGRSRPDATRFFHGIGRQIRISKRFLRSGTLHRREGRPRPTACVKKPRRVEDAFARDPCLVADRGPLGLS